MGVEDNLKEIALLKKKVSELEALKETQEATVRRLSEELGNTDPAPESEDLRTKKKSEDERLKISYAIEQSPTSVVITDTKGNIEYVNPEFCRITGYSAHEAIGKNPNILKSGVHPQEFYDRIWTAISSGKVWRGDICNRKKNGELFWELLSISPIRDNKGTITNFISVKVDDTERRKAEEALRKSEAGLAFAQKMAHLGSWEWDIIKNELSWSDEIYRIFSVEPQEFKATYEAFIGYVHPEDRDFVKESVLDALYRGKNYSIDHRIILPTGIIRIVHEHGEVTFDKSGKPARMFGTVHDITERKKAEEEILKAQKLESLGVLAGGIAHDFNNLLTGIAANISLAKTMLKPGERLHRILSESEKAAMRASDLTQQLLTFSKGGVPVKKTATIGEMIRESSRFSLRGSNTKCEFSIQEDLWPVEADVGQISQVINNLVINAEQAMPRGGVIKIGAANATLDENEITNLKPGRYVKISIKDQGTGIPEGLLKSIFDPYFTTKETGNGLGLATAYSIIKKHDGRITVDSEVNIGTVFHIYLPASSNECVPEKKSDADTLVHGKGRVLLMDDEEIIREAAGELLANIGYEVDFALDGREAIDLYRKSFEAKKPYDVIVMDLTIPGGVGGKEAIKNILCIDPQASAIVSSGYSNDPIMSDFMKFGFKGVIAKPYKIAELSSIVHRIVNGKG